jgi:NAD(P)-dependent dehydrogenase (short-subunit alcohol dehydrogenase family)
MNLDKKVILVTGGSGLLGKEILQDITKNNGIAINLDINCEDDIKKNSLFFDVTDGNSISNGVSKILSRYGKIDGLVNNAYPRTEDWGKEEFNDVSVDSFNKNLEIQLGSVYAVSKPVLKSMRNKCSGSIVNIASIYGMVGNDFTIYKSTGINPPVAYSAIKAGLINMNRYFASYYGEHGVRSNCVSPGGIFDNQNTTFVRQYEKKVPLRRMANPDDIAPVVTFLLSDGAKYVTGQNIVVDGGWTII